MVSRNYYFRDNSGITEFLPISSSGHLVIAQNILGIKSPGNT